MRRVLSAVLVGLGVFLIVLAALFRFWAPDRVEKTPLNLDITQVATGPGTLSAGGGQTTRLQLQATRHVRVDSAASNDHVVVVVETLCLVKLIDNPPACVSADDAKNRLVSLSTDRVATDRSTGLAVNDPQYGEYVNSDTSIRHKGLAYKFPFNTEKTNYPFYDPNSGQSPDAVYQRTETVAGVECYVFVATQKGLKVDVAAGVPGTYDDVRTVWVDPLTGVIVKGIEHQTRTLDTGEVALDTTLTFDQASIDYQAKQAKDGHDKITALTVYAPIGGLVLGLACLVGGFLLARSAGRSGGEGGRHSGRTRPDDGDGPNSGEPSYAGSSQA